MATLVNALAYWQHCWHYRPVVSIHCLCIS